MKTELLILILFLLSLKSYSSREKIFGLNVISSSESSLDVDVSIDIEYFIHFDCLIESNVAFINSTPFHHEIHHKPRPKTQLNTPPSNPWHFLIMFGIELTHYNSCLYNSKYPISAGFWP
jgi:hypothetical protein